MLFVVCVVFYISYSVENCNSVGTNVIIMGVSVVVCCTTVCYFEKQQIENPFLLLSFFFVRAMQSRSQSAHLARETIRDWNLKDSYFVSSSLQ